MSDHRRNETEHTQPSDTGTYQTGSFKPPKRSSGLVAVLLVAVIFLGGIASAMGFINFRLLNFLTQHPNSTTPLSKESVPGTAASNSPLEQIDTPAPTIPADGHVQLQILDKPLFPTEPKGNLSAEQIYTGAEASMVEVYCLTHFNSTQSGMGVVLSADGYILTNAHVIESAKRIFVYLPDDTLVRAALVGSDPFTDLAVLYVEAEGLTPATFCTARGLEVEDPTYAVEALESDSAPYSLRKSTIYSLCRTLSTEHQTLNVMQTYNGGITGPVFDGEGHIIGLQAGKIAQFFDASMTQNLGQVIPTGLIAQIVAELVGDGFVAGRPLLGIEVEAISKLYQHYWELPGGLLLTHIDPDSDAAAQGLQVGDILLALDGQPLSSRQGMYTILFGKSAGSTITAVVFRNGQRHTVNLTVEEAM